MSLSRSENQRRWLNISSFRWLVLIVGFVLFVIISFVLYIRSADMDHRKGENKAIRIAKEQGGLKEVSDVRSHTWDETVWVVSGRDSEDQAYMIWVREGQLLKLKEAEYVSEKQMLDKFAGEHSGVKPIQILPGWFQNQPVWEIRYWNLQDKRHQSIDFYAIKDGAKLKTYELSS